MVINETINATIAADTIPQNLNLLTGLKEGYFEIPNMITNFIFSIYGYRLGWIIGYVGFIILAFCFFIWCFGVLTGD